jgi:hypothetical protein
MFDQAFALGQARVRSSISAIVSSAVVSVKA